MSNAFTYDPDCIMRRREFPRGCVAYVIRLLTHGRAVSDSSRVPRCIVVAAIVAAAVLSGCQKGDGAKAAPAAAAAPAAVAVHTVKVMPRSVPIRFTLPGQIEGSKEVEVRARVSGILQKQLYKEGDPVRPARRCSRSIVRRSRSRWRRRRAQLAQASRARRADACARKRG